MTKDEEYRNDLLKHKENVKKAFDVIFDDINKYLNISYADISILQENIELHDNSSFDEIEFKGNRQWFFHEPNEDKDRDSMLKAWNHHISVNKHHWEYYVNDDRVEEIPDIYLVELLCDWVSFSLKYHTITPLEHYMKIKPKLHPNTERKLKDCLDIIDNMELFRW